MLILLELNIEILYDVISDNLAAISTKIKRHLVGFFF